MLPSALLHPPHKFGNYPKTVNNISTPSYQLCHVLSLASLKMFANFNNEKAG